MELSEFIKNITKTTKRTIEFDIGVEPLYLEGKVSCIWVNKDSKNRIKFTIKEEDI